jgi:hypothetical protein
VPVQTAVGPHAGADAPFSPGADVGRRPVPAQMCHSVLAQMWAVGRSRRRCGPSTGPGADVPRALAEQAALERFYEVHAPEKVMQAAAVVSKYAGIHSPRTHAHATKGHSAGSNMGRSAAGGSCSSSAFGHCSAFGTNSTD